MLRAQRHNFKTYLVELKKKVKEKARAKRKLVEKEKKNQVREQAHDDVREILSHNCIKLFYEQDMAVDVLNFAVDQLKRIKQSSSTVDGFIKKSEAEIKEMRHMILKK